MFHSSNIPPRQPDTVMPIIPFDMDAFDALNAIKKYDAFDVFAQDVVANDSLFAFAIGALMARGFEAL